MEEKMMNTYKNPNPYSPIETSETETGDTETKLNFGNTSSKE